MLFDKLFKIFLSWYSWLKDYENEKSNLECFLNIWSSGKKLANTNDKLERIRVGSCICLLWEIHLFAKTEIITGKAWSLSVENTERRQWMKPQWHRALGPIHGWISCAHRQTALLRWMMLAAPQDISISCWSLQKPLLGGVLMPWQREEAPC